MKDSTVFLTLGHLCMFLVVFCSFIAAPLKLMGGFCIVGMILLAFGYGFLANNK